VKGVSIAVKKINEKELSEINGGFSILRILLCCPKLPPA